MVSELFPSAPPYEGMHPIIVHFPIGLLLAAPLFLVLAMVWKGQSRGFLLSTLILCLAGTGMMLLAQNSGEAAERAAEGVLSGSPGAAATLNRHEDLAEVTQRLFYALCGVLAAATIVYWRFHERASASLRIIGGAILLVLYAGPALALVNAAALGGALVHEHGVLAVRPAPTPAPEALLTPNAPAGLAIPTDPPRGLSTVMGEVQERHDILVATERNGWIPASAAEDPATVARRVAELLSKLQEDERVAARPPDFQTMLKESSKAALDLQAALLTNEPASVRSERLAALAASCSRCHDQFR